jgi:hypothetical protein
MKAKYPGRCRGGDRIAVGDEIVPVPGGWSHRACEIPVVDVVPSCEEQEYRLGVEDAEREKFNRQMFGEEFAAAEEFARDMRGLNGDW